MKAILRFWHDLFWKEPLPVRCDAGAEGSPADCPAGFLPQYNASTMPAFYADMQGGNTIPRIRFDGAGEIEVPN